MVSFTWSNKLRELKSFNANIRSSLGHRTTSATDYNVIMTTIMYKEQSIPLSEKLRLERS